MDQIKPGSIGHVLLDGLTTVTLILTFAAVEYLKRSVFSENAPLVLIIILNIAEVTLAISFAIALVGWLRKFKSELASLFSKPSPATAAPVPKGFIDASLRQAWEIGATTATIVFASFVFLYLLSLVMKAPAWLYWIVMIVGVGLPMMAGITLVQAGNSPMYGSAAAFGIIMGLYICIAAGIFALVMIIVRILVPEAFDHILNFLLLRRY